MWTIGRSQRVEEKKYRPIVRKIRYLIFVGEFKKNVGCITSHNKRGGQAFYTKYTGK
jgi:hypothetical protein